MYPIPSIADSVCPFMERALMGNIEIHPEDEMVADYVVSVQRGESMMAAIIRSLKKQQEEHVTPSKKTLILHNIPRDITVEELRPLFEKYGPIRDIYIPRNKDEKSEHFGTVKGFAMIKYLSPLCAKKAYDAEFGRLYLGFRLISVEYAKEDR
jgi:RNA recognition motif. (a.k.a. RRM, RBD, or RNP domain)